MTTLIQSNNVLRASWHHVNPETGYRMPVFLRGEPGTAKTQSAKDLAKELGIACVVFPCSSMRPEDLSVPDVIGTGSLFDYKVFKELPVVGNDNLPEFGICVADEIGSADTDVQKFFAQMVPPNSKAGTFQVKPGWMFVLTGNGRQHQSGGQKMLRHLLDRCILVDDITIPLKDWVAHGATFGMDPMLTAFHQQSEGRYLGNFDAEAEKSGTFRSWSALNAYMPIHETDAMTFSIMAQGIVGEANAMALEAFLALAKDIPNIDEMLSSVHNARAFTVPTDMAKRWFICAAISRKANAINADAVMAAFRHIARVGGEDMLVASLIQTREHSPEFSHSKAFTDAVLNGDFDDIGLMLGQ